MRCPVLECRHKGSHEHVSRHMEIEHPQIGSSAASLLRILPFVEIKAFRGYLRTYRHRTVSTHSTIQTPADYFQEFKTSVYNIIQVNTVGHRSIKVQMSVVCEFVRGEDLLEYIETCSHYINSKAKSIFNIDMFENFYGDTLNDINSVVEIFEEHGSGWKLNNVLGSDIRVAKYKALRGGCNVDFPPSLAKKRAIINIKNYDKQCFMWAFLSVAHYSDVVPQNRHRIGKYKKFVDRYDWTGVEYPTSMKNISKFESNNRDKKLAVNVFEIVDFEITIRRLSPKVLENDITCYDLLLIHDEEQGCSHFAGVPNIGMLFGKRNCHKRKFCYNCQNFFLAKKMDLHTTNCKNFKTQLLKVPATSVNGNKPVVEFEKHYKKYPHEYVMYLDIESIMTKNCSKSTQRTEMISRHTPCGFCVILVSRYDGVVDHKLYRGKDCMKHLFECLDFFSFLAKDAYANGLSMVPLTPDEVKSYYKATTCHICEKFVSAEQKVRDHDHKTGRYRGPAHFMCNSRYTLKKCKVPIFTHNLKNYDLHLILQGFKYYNGSIKVIPTNSEKYISILCRNFVFLDSMMFLSSSLGMLVERLKDSDEGFDKSFKLMIDFFGLEKARDLSRKGIYFYDYVTSFKMFEQEEFPTRKDFYNVLSQEDVLQEDYAYGFSIYQKYCTNLGDYHDLYLLTDTILLACVMENFRDLAISFYKLDPAHYFTLSGYTWDAALKMTKAKLEKLTSVQQYQFFELGLRGGIAMITTRYAKANNMYMSNYNPNYDSSYIMSWDCNNLYGHALCQKMPVSGFCWLNEKTVNKLTASDIMNWDDNGDVGYVLMVDLEYPSKYHDRDSEYPLAPEKVAVSLNDLSDYQKDLLKTLNIKYVSTTKKLVPHLGTREMYVVHYRNLKYYLQKGLVLTRIYKVLSFKQSDWLKPYIDFNTRCRQQAKDQFSKDLFKFMVNACFGKSCENVRKRKNIIICNDPEEVKELVRKPNFKSFEIINSNVVIIEMEKRTVLLDKAIYTGFATLELSKLVMYKFHMDLIKKIYDCNALLLQTDTDSLSYLVKTTDVYEDMSRIKQYFDFSDYPKDHSLHSEKNKKVMGKFKDEANGKIITEYVGLAPKMYSFVGDGLWKKGAKGVKKCVVNKNLHHRVFKKVFKKQIKLQSKMYLIRSFKHKLHTICLTKTSLHAFDSKRFILSNGVDTLAHNHYMTK